MVVKAVHSCCFLQVQLLLVQSRFIINLDKCEDIIKNYNPLQNVLLLKPE